MTVLKNVPFDDRHSPDIMRIRREVFGQEQGVDADIDFDGQDDLAVHVLVAHEDEYVATGRLLPDGHIGRLAVLRPYRHLGLGSAAVLALSDEAKRMGLRRVYLGSQTQAVDFYAALGFSQYGDPFVEAGIAHIAMQRVI
jgi:predicted GNAT family N-acyltransferase